MLPVIVFYLTVILNTSIVTGSYPLLWKYAFTVLMYKGGDVDDVNNYRPVSLLPVVSKILEKIIANQLMKYLESNRLISDSQHGFRSHFSTETAFLKVSNEIYKDMDEKKFTLLSLSIKKMLKLNIDSFWFRNYLKDCTQSVRIGKIVSRLQFGSNFYS